MAIRSPSAGTRSPLLAAHPGGDQARLVFPVLLAPAGGGDRDGFDQLAVVAPARTQEPLAEAGQARERGRLDEGQFPDGV